MVDFRPVAAVFGVLTVIFAGAAGYFATNPTIVVSTFTSTQPAMTVTQTTTSTVASASATTPFTVNLVYKQGVGFYMTNATGWTLYLRKSDNQTAGTSSCVAGCATSWPPFYASSLTLPANFDQNDFKLVPRTDGIKQLAYYGNPLYYYSKDKAPGDTLGHGVGNVWFACCSLAAVTSTTSTTTTGAAAAVKVSLASGASVNQASPGYSPAMVTVVRGVNASVTWTNNDTTTHTVTSMSVPAGAQSFASGNLNSGATFTFAFTVPGTYTYHCDIHAWMTGTIVVK
jgi:predicted lipoprotein with Yx(FWY)xxD motif